MTKLRDDILFVAGGAVGLVGKQDIRPSSYDRLFSHYFFFVDLVESVSLILDPSTRLSTLFEVESRVEIGQRIDVVCMWRRTPSRAPRDFVNEWMSERRGLYQVFSFSVGLMSAMEQNGGVARAYCITRRREILPGIPMPASD